MTFPSTRTDALPLRPGYNLGAEISRNQDRSYMTDFTTSAISYANTRFGATDSISNNFGSMGSAPSSRSSALNRIPHSPKLHRKTSYLSSGDRAGSDKQEYMHNPNFRYDDNSRVVTTHNRFDGGNGLSRSSSAGRPLPPGPVPLMPSKTKLGSAKRHTDSVAGKGPLRANHDLVSGSSGLPGTHSLDSQKPRELPAAPLTRRKSVSMTNVSNGVVDHLDHTYGSNDLSSNSFLLYDHKLSRAGMFDNIDLTKARKSFQVTRSPSFDNIYSSSRAGRNNSCNGSSSSNTSRERDRKSTLSTPKYHRSLDDVRNDGDSLVVQRRSVNTNGVHDLSHYDSPSRQIQRTGSQSIRATLNRRNSDSVQPSSQLDSRNKRLQRRLSQSNDEDNIEDDRIDRKMNSLNTTGLVGLRNLGNTCFMNSIIQCLSCTKQLRDYFNDENHERDINEVLSPMKGKLAIAFGRLIKEIWSSANAKSVISPNHLKSQIQRYAPRFTGFSQQDSQEFLRFLLEGLHEDLNQILRKEKQVFSEENDISDHEKAVLSWQRYQKREKSLISDLFVGQLKSILTCTMCEKRSVTFDPFWDLSLPIPTIPPNSLIVEEYRWLSDTITYKRDNHDGRWCEHLKIKMTNRVSLYDCFNAFTQEEILDGDEKPTCEHCKKRRKCLKRFLIERFPRVLVIHLKRFSEVRYRTKLNTLVDFPPDLNLSKYAANSGGMKTEVLYRLYSISNHSGGTYSGHYTAYCKHPFTSDWHVFSDSRFDKISPERLVSAEAYVLFYELQIEKSSI